MAHRRNFLTAMALGFGARTAAASTVDPSFPQTRFVGECKVSLTQVIDFENNSAGRRRLINISGGSFKGPLLNGAVVSGDADWNLQPDGRSSLAATYYLRTVDDVNIRIVDSGVGRTGATQLFTHPVFEAPAGRYGWMNQSMFVGALDMPANANKIAMVRIFELV